MGLSSHLIIFIGNGLRTLFDVTPYKTLPPAVGSVSVGYAWILYNCYVNAKTFFLTLNNGDGILIHSPC